MNEAMNTNISDDLKSAFTEWIENMEDGNGSKLASAKVLDILSQNDYSSNELISEILAKKIILSNNLNG